MAFGRRSHVTTVQAKPTFMERITGRPSTSRRTGMTSSTTTGGPLSSSRRSGRTGGGIFSRRSARTNNVGTTGASVGTGPAPMSHHKNHTATTGDRIHGMARKVAGEVEQDPRKVASGEAMMHGGANPNTGMKMGRRSGRTGGGLFGNKRSRRTATAAY
jgi:hypothetical protein